MSKQAFIIFASILGLGIVMGGLGLVAIGSRFEEAYSETFSSQSIEDAKSRNVLVATPKVENKEISSPQYRYKLKEVWIEEIRKVKYKFLLYRTVNVTGYRLLTTFDVTYPSAEWDHLEGCYPLVDGKITLAGSSGGTRMKIFFGRITPPFPEEITVNFDCSR